ncbi:Rdx family protein [Rhodococcus gordoniae]|uniref:Rdx family protein n=1 Tax=Rhodococcus gordoniae TaxID=223392 RepID=UPI003524958A
MTERTPRIAIACCARCRWLLRAGRMAQELLDTFGAALGAVVRDRKEGNGFPEIATLGQWVRELVDPARDLGHVDRADRTEDAPRRDSTDISR